MRGKIIDWDAASGRGRIEAAPGVYFDFEIEHVVESTTPGPGAEARFEPDSDEPGKALRVRVLPGPNPEPAHGSMHMVIADIRIPFASVLVLVIKLAVAAGLVWMFGSLLLFGTMRLFA